MLSRMPYLRNTPLQEAFDSYLDRCKALITPGAETIRAEDACERVTAEPVYAVTSSPAYNAAAMDGIAVIAAHTAKASETAPVTLQPNTDFVYLDTGDALAPPYDAVIMIEDIVELSANATLQSETLPRGTPPSATSQNGALSPVQIRAAATPWQHTRPIGEDFAEGEMIIPSAHCIRPVDIGLILSGGVFELKVTSKPRVAIIPTGTELLDPEALSCSEATELMRQPGTIIDSNSRMIAALVSQAGGEPHRMPISHDEYDQLKATITQAVATHDVVLVGAGSSAGREDFTAPLLEELGKVIVHGVAVKPGKPVILAFVEGKPVIGLPGYPLATFFNFNTFVAPVLALFTKRALLQQATAEATLSKRIVSSLKYREYVQVNVGVVHDKLIAVPLSRGAGVLSSLARADGYLIIEQEREGLEAGEHCKIFLYQDLLDASQTVLAVGSHDLALDIIADLMPVSHPHMHLRSTHVGSLAGLNALARGEAHLAPIHLLDEASGTYNVAAVQQVFEHSQKKAPYALIKGITRIQGIMVAPGNPLNIRGVEDLVDVAYINRQRGAGTRVLFDYLLKQACIDPISIKGYEREGTTHMSVASAIAAGSADAGMGVYSAARTLGLDFIEVGSEEYDFALTQDSLALPQIQAFREVLASPSFHARLSELGGYGYAHAGELIEL